jgi:hypothetical protein
LGVGLGRYLFVLDSEVPFEKDYPRVRGEHD